MRCRGRREKDTEALVKRIQIKEGNRIQRTDGKRTQRRKKRHIEDRKE